MRKLLIPFFVTLVVAGFYCSMTEHNSSSTESSEFVVEKPYFSVAKTIATKKTLEKIVEKEGGLVTNKEWIKFELELPRRPLKMKEFRLEGEQNFTVSKKDQYLGNINIDLTQKIHMDKNMLGISTDLKNPHASIKKYSKTIEINPVENNINQTKIKIKSDISVSKKIPFFFEKSMDKRLNEINAKETDNVKKTIMSETQDTSPVVQFR